MDKERKYVIAIDFDATLTIEHNFPEIGKPRMWLIKQAIKWRKEDGHKLILWTCRENVSTSIKTIFPPRQYLDEAVEWCKSFGLEFDAINQGLEELKYPTLKFSRKIFADFYIDDSNIIFNDDKETLDTGTLSQKKYA